jgi:CheY-like chemotaxis protein
MAESQKLVLLVQTVRLQGLIWQTILRSQNLSVIWEFPDINLPESLDQLKTAGLELPDLLVIDVQIPNFNPYSFCRWCRQHYPEMSIILTNSSQSEISPSQRQWAIHQGASDLFPGFKLEYLVSSAVAVARFVVKRLHIKALNGSLLITSLLAIKHQVERTNSLTLTVLSQPVAMVK